MSRIVPSRPNPDTTRPPSNPPDRDPGVTAPNAKYSPRLVDQASRVAELLDAGYTNQHIARDLGVSRPRVSQIRGVLPQLERYLGQPEPLARLQDHRSQLWGLRRQVLGLAATIRDDLRALDEELEAAAIDRLLGLRS